ncbi:MAG: aminoglycoside phosphotransferase family protein [Anaerolineales bacterium]|nr:aminoglycoside phosphotransferase family protein [Anaerolineales bacterium]
MSSDVVHHIPDVTVRYDLLVPHPSRPYVAVCQETAGYSLPWLEPVEHHTAVVAHIASLARQKYGLEAVAVRILSYQHEREQAAQFRLYQLDNWTGQVELPAGLVWLAEADLAELALAHVAYWPALEAWFAERQGRVPIPDERVPWARPGWYQRLRYWLEKTLAANHWGHANKIELYRAWSISAGLWVATDQGRFYVKASPPQFRRETGVTRFLAEQLPTLYPEVVATDEAEGWLLMRASAAEPLLAQTDISRWQEALARYAGRQQASRVRRDEFADLGCPVRGLAELATEAERLVTEPKWLRPEPGVAFTDEELAQFKALLPELQRICQHYAVAGLAPTLVHGDFHPGNILYGRDGPIFIDWSDACWSHPFMDLAIFLLEDFGNPAAINEQMALVVEAYLASWSAEKPLAELRAEFDALGPVAILFHALSFVRIVANLEPSARWEMHNVVPWLVRQLLTT